MFRKQPESVPRTLWSESWRLFTDVDQSPRLAIAIAPSPSLAVSKSKGCSTFGHVTKYLAVYRRRRFSKYKRYLDQLDDVNEESTFNTCGFCSPGLRFRAPPPTRYDARYLKNARNKLLKRGNAKKQPKNTSQWLTSPPWSILESAWWHLAPSPRQVLQGGGAKPVKMPQITGILDITKPQFVFPLRNTAKFCEFVKRKHKHN